jgi:hypothetical protein
MGLGSNAPGAVAPSARSLSLTMARQERSLWCWAAVATAVGNFYGTGSWSQCQVATASIPNFPNPPPGTFDCCTNAAPCNIFGFLDVALRSTSSFASKQASLLAFSDLQSEIAAGRPVGTRIQWQDGSGHFVALAGWSTDSSGAQWVDVVDPQTGASTQRLSAFPASYRTGGSWTHTYLTHNQTL